MWSQGRGPTQRGMLGIGQTQSYDLYESLCWENCADPPGCLSSKPVDRDDRRTHAYSAKWPAEAARLKTILAAVSILPH